MRHLKKGRKLNRSNAHRKAMLRNMAVSLFRHERIETTDAKAKTIRSFAERLITPKRGDLHARRLAYRDVRDQDVLKKLFDDIGPRYATRPGGYTRIFKLGNRRGDNAPLSMIELVGNESAPTTSEDTE